jgi:invasion protein IalB
LTRFFKQTMAAFALAALALPGPAVAQGVTQDTAPQTETVKATHGDWDIVCSTAQADLCVMRQIGKDAEGNNVIDVRIRKLEGAKGPGGKTIPAMIVVVAPLGVLLPAGVGIKVDEKEPQGAPFSVCLRSGCVMQQPMGEVFLSEMKAGKKAVVQVIAAPKQQINVDISLKGFTKAFKAL